MAEEKEDRILEFLERLDERLKRIESALYPERPAWAAKITRQPRAEQPVFIAPPPLPKTPAPVPQPAQQENTELTALVLGYFAIAALFAGLGYFLHWSVETKVLTATAGMAVGVAAGLLLMLAGEAARGIYARFGHLLHGGGLALIYVALYYGWLRYAALTDVQGIVFTSLVTAGAMGLAIWRNALLTAVLATIGGYTTAYVLGVADKQEQLFLIYLLVLNAGVLGVAIRQSWPAFTLSSLIAATACGIAHIAPRFVPESSAMDQPLFIFMTLYFLEFLAASCFSAAREPEKEHDWEIAVFFLTGAFYFLGCWGLLFLKVDWQPYFGSFTFSLAVFFFGLGWTLRQTRPKLETLTLLGYGIGVTLLTIAFPVQFSGAVPTIFWAAESCAVLWIGFRLAHQRAVIAALVLSALTITRMLFIDSFAQWHPWFNDRLVAYIAATAMCVFFIQGHREINRRMTVIYAVFANGLGLLASSMEVWDYFSELRHDKLLAQAMLSIVWALWGLGLIGFGAGKMNPAVRWSGISLFALAAAKLLLSDLPMMGEGYLALSFSGTGVLLLLAAWLYFRSAIRSKPVTRA